MRVLDTSHMEVVYFGREWPFPDIDPSSKQCICELERNEGLVTWLQPIGGGLEDQIPSIRVGDKFCSLSLRMQKSLFRHVRLKKDFINKEPMSNGSYKLRIPLLLLQEKIRTQTRFNVMRSKNKHAGQEGQVGHSITTGNTATTTTTTVQNKERRGVSSMSKYIDSVLRETILPIALEAPPKFTSFYFTEQDTLETVMAESLKRDCPSLFHSKKSFLDAVSKAYDNIIPPVSRH